MTVIIDTGCANLASVRFAFERLGASAQISADADTILSAERVILPGVGSAQAAMVQLAQRGLLPVLPRIEQPLLGICLGMQLAVIEYARDVAGIEKAHSSELNPQTPDPVVGLITE